MDMISIGPEKVGNTASSDVPGLLPGIDASWSLSKFKKSFKCKIIRMTDLEAEFDIINIDTSIANALRRILLSEIPTMAIENVWISNNTSIIQDEILAHRLGLIPLNVNPDFFRWRISDENGEELQGTDHDSIMLNLNVVCERDPDTKKLVHENVYSSDITFTSQGIQEQWFDDVRPSSENILIAKLKEGQEIDLVMQATLGVGADHAKFSPVATASYRLLPSIKLLKTFSGDQAKRLQKCFPKGVISIVDDKAVVDQERLDTVSREVLRHDEFKNDVVLQRYKNHFIYSIESTGAMAPSQLFLKSIGVLKQKCKILKDELRKSMQTGEDADEENRSSDNESDAMDQS